MAQTERTEVAGATGAPHSVCLYVRRVQVSSQGHLVLVLQRRDCKEKWSGHFRVVAHKGCCVENREREAKLPLGGRQKI